MTTLGVARRGLIHYWRTGVAAALCIALASAVIVGSLLVGSSVRAALRERFVSRLGPYRYAVTTPGSVGATCAGASPALQVMGSVSDEHGVVIPNVVVWGVDRSFAAFAPAASEAVLGDRLAREIGAAAGARLFVRIGKPVAAPADTLFGRRSLEDATVEIPVIVRSVERSPLGSFSLRPSFEPPRNLFVDLGWLRQQLRSSGRSNVFLARDAPPNPKWSLEAFGLRLSGSALHSDRMFLTAGQVAACRKADPQAIPASVGLATEVRNGARSISYAMVASVGEAGPRGDDAWINEWAAKDLDAKPGDRLSLAFLAPRRDGGYGTLAATAVVRRIMPVEAVPSSLVPSLDGLTGSERIGDWKPPFPVELSKVTPRDEQYWKLYHATPRILLSEAALRKVWGGRDFVTGVLLTAKPAVVRERLEASLDPADAGIAQIRLRQEAEKAAAGSTDLGELMLTLGFVLVLAGLLLAGSVLSLNVRARSREMALFASLGAGRVAIRAFLLECSGVAVVGAVLGVPLGIGFASLSLAMLGHFMPAQATLGSIPVDVESGAVLSGFVAAAVVGCLSAWVSVWRGTRVTRPRGRGLARRSSGLTAASLVWRTIRAHSGRFVGLALVSFGAAFVLAAVAGNARSVATGDGGFSLIATSSIPVNVDFGVRAGRARLRFDEANEPLYEDMRVIALRQSVGDDASCLNPAKPIQPRIAGLPRGVVPREGVLGLPSETWANLADGSPAPAIGDAESVEWILGSGLGKTLDTPGGRVRFVGLTHGTALAGHIVVSEEAFRRMFPHVDGPTLFLISTSRPDAVAKALQSDLSDAGIDVQLASEQVQALHGVQNAYLSIFLCLGLVGVLLGTIGAGLLALRSAVERRAELALMLALGFSRSRVGALLCAESVLAVVKGVVAGSIAALAVVHATAIGWILLGALLTIGTTVVVCACVAKAAVSSELLAVLRSE